MNTAARLLARLAADDRVTLPDGAYVTRLYPSPAQRREGAWSWHVWTDESAWVVPSIGSQFTMAQVLEAPTWDVHRDCYSHTHIDPLET